MQVFPQKGAGSGFIINPDGEILTNNHVVQRRDGTDGETGRPEGIQGQSAGPMKASDLALLRIETGGKLPSLHLGESDNLVVGQKVLAIGNPFGFQGTLTTGIVSSLDRSIQTEDSQAAGRHDPNRCGHQSRQ
jgi:serine protease Do